MGDPLIIVWEFRVVADKRAEFARAYGADGLWAQLFRRDKGYIRTELYHDSKAAGRYFTLDFWQSRAAFETFKHTHAADYHSIDLKCESLAAEEKFLGNCDSVEQLWKLLLKHGIDLDEEPRIRPAISSDIPAMRALEQAALSAAHWDVSAYDIIFESAAAQRIALVVETDHQLIGFVVARIAGADCELENIVVDHGSQRRGAGSQLITALTGAARALNVTSIFLEVRESNVAARALYKKCGFVFSGRRAAYYQSPSEAAITYVLQL